MKDLTGLHRGDAAIVGSGLTGLLLASSLAQAGLRVILLDTGESELTPGTGLGTTLCISAYRQIEAAHGIEAAKQHATALQSHLTDMLAVPQPYVQSTAVYLYARTADELPRLHAAQELMHRLGISASLAPDAGSCPFPVEHSLMAGSQAAVNMAQWKAALLGNIRRHGGQCFTSAAISTLQGSKVCTRQGCLEAPIIVFAGGLPPSPHKPRQPNLLERRLLLLRELSSPFPLYDSQLPVSDGGVTLLPASNGAFAFGDTGRCGTHRQQERLRVFDAAINALLPDWKQSTTHTLYETFSADGLPVIGNVPGTRLLCASGCGASGILGAIHAAAVLTQRILGHPLPDDRIYAPDRPLPAWLVKQQRRQHRLLALQTLLRRGAPACSHCGCRMRYAPLLARWDCPACGSVFDMLGQVVCGPAMRSADVSVRQRPDW